MLSRAGTAALLALAVGIPGCNGNSVFSAPPPQPVVPGDSAVLPLTLDTPSHDKRPMITLRVGGGPPSRFMFDTGSAGLRVFDTALGPNAVDTNIPVEDVGFGERPPHCARTAERSESVRSRSPAS